MSLNPLSSSARANEACLAYALYDFRQSSWVSLAYMPLDPLAKHKGQQSEFSLSATQPPGRISRQA